MTTKQNRLPRGSVKRRVELLFLLLVSLSATILDPSGASAHAYLAGSDPEPGSVVSEAPSTVTMRFTEPLEWSYSRAELYDQDGALVAGTSVRPGSTDYVMVLELPATLLDGTYSVLWRTLSTADGHTAQNYIAFTIGSEDDIAAITQPPITGDGQSGWGETVARGLALTGLAASVAVWPLWIFVVRPGLAPQWRVARAATRAVRRFAVIAILIGLAGNVLALLIQASALRDGALVDNLVTTLRDTRYGSLWMMRVALLLLYGLCLQWVAWWWPLRRPIRADVAMVLALALPLPFSLIAHASAQTTGRGVAIFNDYLHLVAASLWAGGLFLMATVLISSLREQASIDVKQVLASTLPRFSTLALTAWVVMILSGLYSAWLHVGGWDALVDTGYGRTLMVKLGLLVPILLLAAFNLLIVTRRLRMSRAETGWFRWFGLSLGGELVLATAVLMVVGSLTSQAPGRDQVNAAPDGVEVELVSAESTAIVTVSPGTPGPNRIEVSFPEPLTLSTQVLLRVEHDEQDTGQRDIELASSGTGDVAYQGAELSLPGTWNLELIVRPPDAFEQRLYGAVEMESAHRHTHADGGRPEWVLSSASAIAGMLAVLSGSFALVLAWQFRSRRYSRWAGSGGLVGVVLGVVMLLDARTELHAAASAVLEAAVR